MLDRSKYSHLIDSIVFFFGAEILQLNFLKGVDLTIFQPLSLKHLRIRSITYLLHDFEVQYIGYFLFLLILICIHIRLNFYWFLTVNNWWSCMLLVLIHPRWAKFTFVACNRNNYWVLPLRNFKNRLRTFPLDNHFLLLLDVTTLTLYLHLLFGIIWKVLLDILNVRNVA